MKLRNPTITLVVLAFGLVAAQSHAATRSLRIDNPGFACDLESWVAFFPDPYLQIDGNGNGAQSSATFFNPGTVVTAPATFCTPNQALATIWSNDSVDLPNPASQPDGTNSPTIFYLTATAAVMYEWINPSDTNLTPDAEVIVWSLPPSSTLGAGAVEIEFDNWCNNNDSGTAAQSGASPSFTWRGYKYTFTDTCAKFNGYDLIISGSGVLLGYVDLSDATYFSATAPGWQIAVTPGTNNGVGSGALNSNTTGADNTAVGTQALYLNTTGNANAAFGYQALYSNTSGYNNSAFGLQVLQANTTGIGNAAQGAYALGSNTSGVRNTAIGNKALEFDFSGSYNTALGYFAGSTISTGSNNIDIGNTGGSASESNTIRIGTSSAGALTPHTAAYMAGINGATVTGSAVYVTSGGQLGVLGSSERFKTDIAPMPELSDKLQKLRPVTFRYKSDPRNVKQYGLIAEEVAKVYPELVIRDDSDQIQGVHYEELAPLLLQEVQQQRRKLLSQSKQLAAQRQSLDAERSLRDAERQKIAQLEQQFAAQVRVQRLSAAAWNTELNMLKQQLAKLQKAQ